MGAARIEQDKETDEVGKKTGVNMEKNQRGHEKKSHGGLSQPNQNKIIINMMWYFRI